MNLIVFVGMLITKTSPHSMGWINFFGFGIPGFCSPLCKTYLHLHFLKGYYSLFLLECVSFLFLLTDVKQLENMAEQHLYK